jgi:hypothetical protein
VPHYFIPAFQAIPWDAMPPFLHDYLKPKPITANVATMR